MWLNWEPPPCPVWGLHPPLALFWTPTETGSSHAHVPRPSRLPSSPLGSQGVPLTWRPLCLCGSLSLGDCVPMASSPAKGMDPKDPWTLLCRMWSLITATHGKPREEPSAEPGGVSTSTWDLVGGLGFVLFPSDPLLSFPPEGPPGQVPPSPSVAPHPLSYCVLS